MFSIGAVQLSVALRGCGCATLIENAGSEAVALPSLTVMTMLEYEPAWLDDGVPES